jgi:hypothetical protein
MIEPSAPPLRAGSKGPSLHAGSVGTLNPDRTKLNKVLIFKVETFDLD